MSPGTYDDWMLWDGNQHVFIGRLHLTYGPWKTRSFGALNFWKNALSLGETNTREPNESPGGFGTLKEPSIDGCPLIGVLPECD